MGMKFGKQSAAEQETMEALILIPPGIYDYLNPSNGEKTHHIMCSTQDFITLVKKHKKRTSGLRPNAEEGEVYLTLDALLKVVNVNTNSLPEELVQQSFIFRTNLLSKSKKDDDTNSVRSHRSHVSKMSNISNDSDMTTGTLNNGKALSTRSQKTTRSRTNKQLPNETQGQSKIRRAEEFMLSPYRIEALKNLKAMLLEETYTSQKELIYEIIRALLKDGINSKSSQTTPQIINQVISEANAGHDANITNLPARCLNRKPDTKPNTSIEKQVTFLAYFDIAFSKKPEYFFPIGTINHKDELSDQDSQLAAYFKLEYTNVISSLKSKVLTPYCIACINTLGDMAYKLKKEEKNNSTAIALATQKDSATYILIALLTTLTACNNLSVEQIFDQIINVNEQEDPLFTKIRTKHSPHIQESITRVKKQTTRYAQQDTLSEASDDDKIAFGKSTAFLMHEIPRFFLRSLYTKDVSESEEAKELIDMLNKIDIPTIQETTESSPVKPQSGQGYRIAQSWKKSGITSSDETQGKIHQTDENNENDNLNLIQI